MTRCVAAIAVIGLLAVLGVVLAANLAAAGNAGGAAMDPGDWPQWRGPNRDGISTEKGLLDKWPEGGPPLLWRLPGCGNGLSAIIVLKGRFYIMGDTSQGATLQCFDLETRKQIWSRYIGPP
jgi:outer membrane protein assembly factor BamB